MSSDYPTQQGSLRPVAPEGGGLTSTSKDDNTMAMLAHLGGGVVGFLVPLIVWLVKKDQSRFVDQEGKEALNFQLNILVLEVILAVVTICLGGVGALIPYVYGLVMGIIAGVQTNKGLPYRYPATVRLIK